MTRISSRVYHPDYRPDNFLFTVFLDGEELMHCVWADEEAGQVEVMEEGPDGKLIFDQGKKCYATLVKSGIVTLKRRDMAGPHDEAILANAKLEHEEFLAKQAAEDRT